MDYNNLEYHYFFLKEIENKYGRHITYFKDCTALSESVKKITGQRISPLTLSRIFLHHNNGIKPRLFTIDTLAIYIGFFDYRHFLQALADGSVSQEAENQLSMISFKNVVAFWDKDLICRFISGIFSEFFEQKTNESISENLLRQIKKNNYPLNENNALNDLIDLPFSFSRDLPQPNGDFSNINFKLLKLGSGRTRGILILQITDHIYHKDWEKDILKQQFGQGKNHLSQGTIDI